ncbi:MAG: argininosuccinate lyase, partial [Lacunisphaera sp.]|nr:argininosuccinate lyase [Lacunisphaera sp.]
LQVLAGTVAGLKVYRQKCAAAVADPALLATDLADYLVRRGVAFREAHHAVGAVVRLAEQKQVALDKLTLADVRTVHPKFAKGWVDSFQLQKAMARRKGTGMPGPAQVAREFKRWQKLLG